MKSSGNAKKDQRPPNEEDGGKEATSEGN